MISSLDIILCVPMSRRGNLCSPRACASSSDSKGRLYECPCIVWDQRVDESCELWRTCEVLPRSFQKAAHPQNKARRRLPAPALETRCRGGSGMTTNQMRYRAPRSESKCCKLL